MITRDVHQAVAHLRSGNLVAIPTETVYGLAAVASNESAIRRVFEAKARPFFDPLIVHISSWPELDSLVESVSEIERHLLEAFWPGPLTLVSAKRGIVSDLITSGHPSVAVRMPAHPLCQELLKLLGEPVVAPSANQFGRTSPTTAEHVVSEFKESDNVLVLDGGEDALAQLGVGHPLRGRLCCRCREERCGNFRAPVHLRNRARRRLGKR